MHDINIIFFFWMTTLIYCGPYPLAKNPKHTWFFHPLVFSMWQWEKVRQWAFQKILRQKWSYFSISMPSHYSRKWKSWTKNTNHKQHSSHPPCSCFHPLIIMASCTWNDNISFKHYPKKISQIQIPNSNSISLGSYLYAFIGFRLFMLPSLPFHCHK